MPLLMLKPENPKNIVNSSKEYIKFSGNKDAPKKLQSSHKDKKIATKKAPKLSTSFIQMHYPKERNPCTFKYVQTNALKNLTHNASISQQDVTLLTTKAKHTIQQQTLPLQNSFSTVFFPLQEPLCYALTYVISTSSHRDFGVKVAKQTHADHLINSLKKNYDITIYHSGKIFCGIRLKWDQQKGTVDLSMTNYVRKELAQFQHPTPNNP